MYSDNTSLTILIKRFAAKRSLYWLVWTLVISIKLAKGHKIRKSSVYRLDSRERNGTKKDSKAVNLKFIKLCKNSTFTPFYSIDVYTKYFRSLQSSAAVAYWPWTSNRCVAYPLRANTSHIGKAHRQIAGIDRSPFRRTHIIRKLQRMTKPPQRMNWMCPFDSYPPSK